MWEIEVEDDGANSGDGILADEDVEFSTIVEGESSGTGICCMVWVISR